MTPIYTLLTVYLMNYAHIYNRPHEENLGDRMDVIAITSEKAIEDVIKEYPRVNQLKLAAALMAVAEGESRFAKYVHENRCSDGPWKCGGYDKALKHYRARSIFQLEEVACKDDWHNIVGADNRSSYLAARCAARILARGFTICKNVKEVFNHYIGKPCNSEWKGSKRRVKRFNRIYDKLLMIKHRL